MTKDKAQKQAVRTRMAKTGERYRIARYYLLDLHRQEQADADLDESSSGGEEPDTNALSPSREVAADTSPLVRDATPDAAKTALPPRVAEPGVSNAAVQRATGKSWDEWFALLDAWQGTTHKTTP